MVLVRVASINVLLVDSMCSVTMLCVIGVYELSNTLRHKDTECIWKMMVKERYNMIFSYHIFYIWPKQERQWVSGPIVFPLPFTGLKEGLFWALLGLVARVFDPTSTKMRKWVCLRKKFSSSPAHYSLQLQCIG